MVNEKNIFVVDDDPVFRMITKKLFEKNFPEFNVDFFPEGKEAITELTRRTAADSYLPAIILLDIEMPVLNGWGFMEAYIKTPEQCKKDIKVFIVTSSIAPEDRAKSETYREIKGYITKPLTAAILGTIINS